MAFTGCWWEKKEWLDGWAVTHALDRNDRSLLVRFGCPSFLHFLSIGWVDEWWADPFSIWLGAVPLLHILFRSKILVLNSIWEFLREADGPMGDG